MYVSKSVGGKKTKSKKKSERQFSKHIHKKKSHLRLNFISTDLTYLNNLVDVSLLNLIGMVEEKQGLCCGVGVPVRLSLVMWFSGVLETKKLSLCAFLRASCRN